MGDNLVFLINKLSYVIVSQNFGSDSLGHSRKDECYFNKCLKKVRQTGCDVLLKKSEGTPLEDPCLTDYGGNWSPFTLITDYGRELQEGGAGKCNDLLVNCLRTLEEKQHDSINEILKFLLLLKKPVVREVAEHFQKELSFSCSDSLLQSIELRAFVSENCPKDQLSKSSSHKKALKYEESWTKNFDAKFQLLGEFSKKNLTPDKVSLNSLFPSTPLVNSSQSRSNSFVFPDFSNTRNFSSEKSLFDISSSTYVNDRPLLDNFVDQPITHKLPTLSLNSKFSKGGFLEKSSLHIRGKFPSFSEEEHPKRTSQAICSLKNSKPSVIELKRNSNCSHSFAILYEKSAKSQISSNDSLPFLKSKGKDKSTFYFSSSKDIILGLWDQEQTLIREFRPELANDLPTLRMITLVEYVEDVKYLFTGINSGTFKYDSNSRSFSMVYGTCLDDVTPESLYDFSREFLEIGNCYMLLSSRVSDIGKNNFDTCTTTTQAFWKSIFDFLELHYSLVLDIPFSVNLLSLKTCTKNLHEIIMTVASICKVFNPEEPLPKGGELITYLLEFAEKINKQSVLNIMFGILQNCCTIYFMCVLQSWMFKGKLENQGNEFFVDCRRQKIKTKSRAYYNSFYLIDEKVPSFLRGYENSVYNCGKSVHFLRLFNAENKLCQVLEKTDYPSMCVCFSEEQLLKVEKEFKSYEERVVKLCGERITVKAIRDEEKEKERAYLEYVKESKREEEERRERERMKELEEAKEARAKQNQLLNEQRSLIEAERERRRQKEEAERLQVEKEMKRAETERQNLVNQEKNLLASYYDHKIGNVNAELRESEKRQERLKKILAGKGNESELDLINDNRVQTDCEGNRTSTMDINSNTSTEPSESFMSLNYSVEGISLSRNVSTRVFYDENSNPRMGNETICSDPNANSLKSVDEVTRKSMSYRTVAAEEAERNKCKVLRSEFGLPVRKVNPATKEIVQENPQSPVVMSDVERNRRNVLDVEYNLLKKPNQDLSLRNVQQNTQILVCLEARGTKISEDSFRSAEFAAVELERKLENINLKKLSLHSNPVRKESAHSYSSDSYVTSNELFVENVSTENAYMENASTENASMENASTENASMENASTENASMENASTENASMENASTENASTDIPSNLCEEMDNLQTPCSSSMIINEKYQEALALDVNVFHHKVSHQNIFCNLKEHQLDSLPCTDFMVFQRYLRKSALIPLKIQEKLANDALLKHLLRGENLLSHLNSLRGYFFLNDGEFGRSFTHHTFRSLAKCTEPQQFFERSNLSNIVNEALNYTIHNCEPNSQNLSFRIVKMPPFLNHSSHDVLSPFELSYKVDWPLTIILTEKALSKYKMVFRFLLKLKRINWTLNENFLYLNSQFKTRRLREGNLKGSVHYHRIQIYRHAMTQVMITLDDYFFSNGVQFPWIYFLKDLETTENIDHLYQKHVRYIKDVLTRCFLSKNSEDLLECIHNMIELALKFHYTAKSSVLEVVNGRYEHPKFPVLKSTFNEFCTVIKTFLKTLKEKISSNQVLKSHYVLIEKFDLKLT